MSSTDKTRYSDSWYGPYYIIENVKLPDGRVFNGNRHNITDINGTEHYYIIINNNVFYYEINNNVMRYYSILDGTRYYYEKFPYLTRFEIKQQNINSTNHYYYIFNNTIIYYEINNNIIRYYNVYNDIKYYYEKFQDHIKYYEYDNNNKRYYHLTVDDYVKTYYELIEGIKHSYEIVNDIKQYYRLSLTDNVKTYYDLIEGKQHTYIFDKDNKKQYYRLSQSDSGMNIKYYIDDQHNTYYIENNDKVYFDENGKYRLLKDNKRVYRDVYNKEFYINKYNKQIYLQEPKLFNIKTFVNHPESVISMGNYIKELCNVSTYVTDTLGIKSVYYKMWFEDVKKILFGDINYKLLCKLLFTHFVTDELMDKYAQYINGFNYMDSMIECINSLCLKPFYSKEEHFTNLLLNGVRIDEKIVVQIVHENVVLYEHKNGNIEVTYTYLKNNQKQYNRYLKAYEDNYKSLYELFNDVQNVIVELYNEMLKNYNGVNNTLLSKWGVPLNYNNGHYKVVSIPEKLNGDANDNSYNNLFGFYIKYPKLYADITFNQNDDVELNRLKSQYSIEDEFKIALQPQHKDIITFNNIDTLFMKLLRDKIELLNKGDSFYKLLYDKIINYETNGVDDYDRIIYKTNTINEYPFHKYYMRPMKVIARDEYLQYVGNDEYNVYTPVLNEWIYSVKFNDNYIHKYCITEKDGEFYNNNQQKLVNFCSVSDVSNNSNRYALKSRKFKTGVIHILDTKGGNIKEENVNNSYTYAQEVILPDEYARVYNNVRCFMFIDSIISMVTQPLWINGKMSAYPDKAPVQVLRDNFSTNAIRNPEYTFEQCSDDNTKQISKLTTPRYGGVTVIKSATGTGKSTVIPLLFMSATEPCVERVRVPLHFEEHKERYKECEKMYFESYKQQNTRVEGEVNEEEGEVNEEEGEVNEEGENEEGENEEEKYDETKVDGYCVVDPNLPDRNAYTIYANNPIHFNEDRTFRYARRKVLCTQPRVITTKNMVNYVSASLSLHHELKSDASSEGHEEIQSKRDVKCFGTIGSHSDEKNRTSEHTKLSYITEDTLIHKIKDLSEYGKVKTGRDPIIDKMHNDKLSDILKLDTEGEYNFNVMSNIRLKDNNGKDLPTDNYAHLEYYSDHYSMLSLSNDRNKTYIDNKNNNYKSDPLFSEYSTIVIDEVHERSLGTDMLLRAIKRYINRYPYTCVRFIITSATMNENEFMNFMTYDNVTPKIYNFYDINDTPFSNDEFSQGYKKGKLVPITQSIDGESNFVKCIVPMISPLEIEAYGTLIDETKTRLTSMQAKVESIRLRSEDISSSTNDTTAMIEHIVKLCERIHESHSLGDFKSSDIIVFLPTKRMIDSTITALRNVLTEEQAELYELTRDSYAKMADSDKRIITDKDIDKLKIILSTDVAETGVTFSKVKYVIDTVKRKSVLYDSRTGIYREAVINVSKNSSEQRMGRTGRVMDGYYFPLLTYDEYNLIRNDSVPKIHSVVTESFDQHMLRILLEYKDDVKLNDSVGVFDSLMTRPSYETVCDSIDRLFTASAIDHNCEVTEVGKLIDRIFTNDIEYSLMILASVKEKCVTDTVRIVAIMITDPSTMFTDTAHSIDTYTFNATVMYTFGKLRLTEDAKQILTLLKCDYINLLAIYKEYLKHCTVNGNEIGVTNDAIEWCNSNGINHTFMDRVNKRFIKIMDKIMEKEDKDNKDRINIPVIDSLKEEYNHYSSIKKVVLSGLQRNVAVYVDTITQGSAQVPRYQLILPNAPDVTILATIDTTGLPPVMEYGERVVYGRCDRKESGDNIVYKIRYVTECP